MRELAATPPRAAGPLAVSYTSRVQAQDAASAAFVQAIALASTQADLWYELGTSLFFAGVRRARLEGER